MQELKDRILAAAARVNGCMTSDFESARVKLVTVRSAFSSLKNQGLLVGRRIPSNQNRMRWFTTQEACDLYFDLLFAEKGYLPEAKTTVRSEASVTYADNVKVSTVGFTNQVSFIPKPLAPIRSGSQDFMAIKSKLPS